MSKLYWILSRLARALWVRVSAYALLGILAAMFASLGGRLLNGNVPVEVSTEAIEGLLTIIATSMLTVTSFSVGALTSAYSSATSNATPRATPLLTEDQLVQNALATFVGSFLFSIVGIVALKVSVYGPEGRAILFFVTLGVILLIVIALLRWINQLTKLGRVRDTVDRIEEATDTSMRGRVDLPYLGGGPLGDETRGAPVPSDTVGYVQFIDTDKLSAICEDLGAEIDVQVLPGVFVYQGSVLARVAGQDEVAEEAAERIRDTFTIGLVRTIDQDPRFGLVVLCEVAQRALSPGVNDPGTAIDVIGRQTRLLSYWGDAWEGADRVEPKYPRLRVPALDYHDMFEDAFNLIARDGAAQVEVVLRLTKALKALTTIGPEPSRAAARRQLEVALTRARAQLPIDDDHRRLDEALEMPRSG
ncbi:DUF2254 domain-containing protein [Albibacillus kandeliae]|uniref:DUF2254 domain-containing protein n=1 Tax=Albibacillus kandeliae TaxID=2174228 RepID=UPI000D686AB1|nr:DUF2254 domain-containing protein [Albibacillus kandeliae]